MTTRLFVARFAIISSARVQDTQFCKCELAIWHLRLVSSAAFPFQINALCSVSKFCKWCGLLEDICVRRIYKLVTKMFGDHLEISWVGRAILELLVRAGGAHGGGRRVALEAVVPGGS